MISAIQEALFNCSCMCERCWLVLEFVPLRSNIPDCVASAGGGNADDARHRDCRQQNHIILCPLWRKL